MSAADAPQSLETRVAVIDRSVTDCQRTESECRENNKREHNEFFDRLREAEKQIALVSLRIAIWSAVGSMIGTGVLSIIVYYIQRRLVAG